MLGGAGSLGPAWTRGEIEAPAGEKDMGTWVSAVYTAEQQARLGVDESGAPLNTAGPADPGGFREQFDVVDVGSANRAGPADPGGFREQFDVVDVGGANRAGPAAPGFREQFDVVDVGSANRAGPADAGGFREQFTVVGEGPELKARGAAAKAAKACATPAAACCRGCPRSSSDLSSADPPLLRRRAQALSMARGGQRREGGRLATNGRRDPRRPRAAGRRLGRGDGSADRCCHRR